MRTSDRTTAPPLHRTGLERTGAVERTIGCALVRWSAHPVRTTVHRVRSTRWAVRAPVRPARGSGAHWMDAVRWSGPE
ncbi:hypothetical protein [Streptomyces sp. DH12]|uniref:hypothetical protein n=1 Tax=Streptomyces sp. DH12 TaxID=2857010 RepID=UPI001E2A4FFB|nr:hypothetical protein [Streptomyces sp. DH12]